MAFLRRSALRGLLAAPGVLSLALASTTGCGLLLDVDPHPDADADASVPPVRPTPPLECDYYVFVDRTGTGAAMDDPSGDFAGTVSAAGDAGGGVVCVASGGTYGACEASSYTGEVTLGRGVTIQGGFLAGELPWAWDPECKPKTKSLAPGFRASVRFDDDADETSSLTYMQVDTPRGLQDATAVLFLGGGNIVQSEIRATAGNRAAGIYATLRDEEDAGPGGAITIRETTVALRPAAPEMAAVVIDRHRVTITGSTFVTADGAMQGAGIGLVNAPGSRIADGNRIEVGTADEHAVAIYADGNSEGVVIENNVLIRVANSDLANDTSGSAAIAISSACDGEVRIENNRRIIGGGPRGVLDTNFASAILTQGCKATIRGNAQITGRDVAGVGRAVGIACLADCTIEDNAIAGASNGAAADLYNYGVIVYGANVELRRNEIDACGGSAEFCYGVLLLQTPDAIVSRNTIRATGIGGPGAGIILRGSTTTEVFNNMVVVGSGPAVLVERSSVPGTPESAAIYFNTLIEAARSPSLFFHGLSVSGDHAEDDLQFYNNLVTCDPDNEQATFVRQAAPMLPSADMSHNAMYGCAIAYRYGALNTPLDLDAFDALVPGGTQTLLLGDYPFDAEYNLLPTSPARDALEPTDSTPEFDIDGDLRDSMPDIGADEVVSP